MQCANLQCQAESAYLRDGGLYWIEEVVGGGHAKRGRYIWLCGTCAPRFVVETWRPPGEQLRPAGALCPPLSS